jgi:hypothetical protein
MSQNLIISEETRFQIKFTLSEIKVMLDRDLAMLYGIENKRLKEQVKRNISRFLKILCLLNQIESQT